MTNRILTALLLVCTAFSGYATTYYISHNGSDSNSGTSPSSPWRNISKLQQVMFSYQPGDQILFERGGLYPGQVEILGSGTSSQPIVIGAYGSGENPIISGGVPVTNWVQHSGNIWRAALSTAPKYVLVNNEPITLARYPNTGFIYSEEGSNSHVRNSSLNQSSGYWNGAELHIRTTNWCYETATITSSSSNGTLYFNSMYSNIGNDDWGFFLSNKLSQLDMAGEWYHDAASGQLYLWAPNNANPNSLSVLASIYEKGVIAHWQRSNIKVENLTIQGHTMAAIGTETAYNVTVQNCVLRHCYNGIYSSGANNVYRDLTIQNTFATALNILDSNTLIENNVLTDIAVQAGMGEDLWGHMGINATGAGTIVRSNRLSNVGYIGISIKNNVLCEKNVVSNATSILNDGAGITFDHCDGVIVRDNIVKDCLGSLESVATSHSVYYPVCFGIYFGNTTIKNTIVQRNTVTRCNGAGIHVDHTMVSQGNQVKDNVIFDNNVQLSISDFSNYNGPGATPPYYVANFNTIYSGNHLYSVREDQLCMRFYEVNSTNHTDFGTFTNNKYFNPFQELSIMIRNSVGAGTQYFTLERWQSTYGEDAGSSRSPLRLNKYATASELSSDLIMNGGFDDQLIDWIIYPFNGLIEIDHDYLDDGALKVQLPNNSQYNSLNVRSPYQFSIQNGQWYRMRLSIQSDIQGMMRAGVKGVSQLTNGYEIAEKEIPFSTERRDLEFYFQSSLSDQAMLQLSNDFVHPRYWVDNVELHRVTVQELDPHQDHKLFYNELTVAQSFSLPSGCWADINGTVLNGDITLQPYTSKIIYRVPGNGCGAPAAGHTVGAKVVLGGALNANGTMRTDLKDNGLLPSTEPYSAMGITLENAGAQISSSVLSQTGSNAVVDWIYLELRDPSNYSAVARRAALVKANGDVIAPDGSSQVPFTVATQGKHLAIGHRNHLSIMTASPIASNAQVIDLTTSNTSTYGTGARMTQGSIRGMWPGDVNANGMISYTNAGNDRDEVLIAIGSVVPSQVATGYLAEDVNLDGFAKYTGTSNDRDVILISIGGTVPTSIKLAQMP